MIRRSFYDLKVVIDNEFRDHIPGMYTQHKVMVSLNR